MEQSVSIVSNNSNYFLQLSNPSDFGILSYEEDGETKFLVEYTDYYFANSKLIVFIIDPTLLTNLRFIGLTYDYESQNPAKLIDTKAGNVVSDVPIWNPYYSHYNQKPYSIVDIKRSSDPAIYNIDIDSTTYDKNIWTKNFKDYIWFDDSIEGYIPYYDKTLTPDIDQRIFNWGKLAEWADYKLYRWVETELSPEEWEQNILRLNSVESELDFDILENSGIPKKILYQNTGTQNNPIWNKVSDIHEDYIAGLVNVTNTTSLSGNDLLVYVNGIIDPNPGVTNGNDLIIYCSGLSLGSHVHIVKPAAIPTEDQLENLEYRYYTPRVELTKVDPKSGNPYTIYYYWVADNKKSINIENYSTSPFQAELNLKFMQDPYMILQGWRTPDFGYGLIFGHVFDESGFDLPYRYTQLIVKNLRSKVKDDDRYILRFTRDFTLRDNLNNASSALEHKNKHVEWKLFREKQFFKIDYVLWKKAIEALIGYNLDLSDNIDFNSPIPSIERQVYDTIYNKDSSIGLGNGQVMLPSSVGLDTLNKILREENTDFKVDIADFIQRHPLNTIQDIKDAMEEIYQTFSIEEVNRIYFSLLHDAFVFKKEYEEFFKTSWVGIQINQNVNLKSDNLLPSLKFIETEGCQIEIEPEGIECDISSFWLSNGSNFISVNYTENDTIEQIDILGTDCCTDNLLISFSQDFIPSNESDLYAYSADIQLVNNALNVGYGGLPAGILEIDILVACNGENFIQIPKTMAIQDRSYRQFSCELTPVWESNGQDFIDVSDSGEEKVIINSIECCESFEIIQISDSFSGWGESPSVLIGEVGRSVVVSYNYDNVGILEIELTVNCNGLEYILPIVTMQIIGGS
jgi:hypothetical protein